jgi:hypothetical protein
MGSRRSFGASSGILGFVVASNQPAELARLLLELA